MSDPSRPRLRWTTVLIALAMIVLMGIGVMAIHVSQQANGTTGLTQRQLVYGGMGLAAFVVCTAVPYPRFGRLAYPLFAFSLLLLLVLAVCRVLHMPSRLIPETNGSYRWIDLGVTRFQPSELAKLAQILLLAWYLRLGDHYRRLWGLLPLFVLTFVPMGLILIEPDLGTSLLFLPILYAMLFLAGAKLKHLLGIVAIATILIFLPVPRSTADMGPRETGERRATCYWTHTVGGTEYIVSAAPLAIMEFHQLQRIDGWLRQGDESSTQGKGYQLHLSKTVLGSGKATGRGEWDTAEVYFRRLPEDHTDFIFSIIGGQWGFAGCIVVLGLYAVIVVAGVEIAGSTYDPFGRLLAVGVISLLAAQIFINVGMTMGLMPITGMTLPLISYGGSSLMVNCAALGLLANVGQRRPILLSRRAFEHREDFSPAPYRPLEMP